jgi:hypothetical protein
MKNIAEQDDLEKDAISPFVVLVYALLIFLAFLGKV